MVEDARKALAEGREPPMSLPFLNMQLAISPTVLAATRSITSGNATTVEVTEKLDAPPAHMRTSSTQVEPATPPKWISNEEAEETVKQANAWAGVEDKGVVKRPQKKERPTGELFLNRM